MRKLTAFLMVSIDGYYAGPNGELDWLLPDPEFNTYRDAQDSETDTFIFGRVTYEMMAASWPHNTDQPEMARRMNDTAKVVFSHTLERADWGNTRLVKTDPAEEIRRLKALPGKDMIVLGSGALLTELVAHGVVDGFMLLVLPVALGAGKPLFKGLPERTAFKLRNAHAFTTGSVLLEYESA